MSSFSHFYYSDYMCSNEFSSQLPTDHLITSSAITAPQLTLPFSDMNGAAVCSMVPFDSDISCSSSSSSSSSSSLSSIAAALSIPEAERLGASDTSHDPALVSPTNYATLSGSLFGISGNEGLSSGAGNYCHQHDRANGFGDQECGILASNFWPIYPSMTSDNWEIQGGVAQRTEEPTLKVARYSAEERKDRILRYLKKRSRRNFNKTIKYACRKTLADKRVRVRGRFAKNNECAEDDQTLVVKTGSNLQQAESCYNIIPDDLQIMKSYDEEWLQEAIASLMYYRVAPENVLELPDKYLMS